MLQRVTNLLHRNFTDSACRMSTGELGMTGNANPNENIQSKTTNEHFMYPLNRKRPVQYTNEHESQNHTPKRNRAETTNVQFDCNLSSPVRVSDIHTADRTSPPTTASYFNTRQQLKQRNNESSTRTRHESPKQTFPPFRVTLHGNADFSLTELGIIKEINRHCHLNLTYGRFAKTTNDQVCFLLYASSFKQFEHLMSKSNWPPTINSANFNLELPSKIPASYSMVISNVPSQWSTQSFADELKRIHPSIVRVVRLFRNGGRPLPKVRADFSSHVELSAILRAKRIVLDDANTAFPVEPYLPPTRILRCYNCQAYDDHIAAHCPNKNTPVCFRCAQHHPYNSNCNNPIKCAHCNGNHMAGNPSCPIKSEKRQEKNQRMGTEGGRTSSNFQQHNRVWSGNTIENLFGTKNQSYNSTVAETSRSNNSNHLEVIVMFDKLNSSMQQIKEQQNELNKKFDTLNRTLDYHRKDVNQLNHCVYEIICPLIKVISMQVQSKAKIHDKHIISPLHNKLIDFIASMENPNNENLLNAINDKPKSIDPALSNNDYITKSSNT